MFIRRCAWHPRYQGHGKVLGISSLRGWTVTFSDGMCDRCAVRVRQEWGLPPLPEIQGDHRSWRPAFPYVTVGLAASVAGVAFAILVGPPMNASGPPRVLSRSESPTVEIAHAPAASPAVTVPPVSERPESRFKPVPATPSSETLADEAVSAPDRARMAAGRAVARS